MVFLHQAAIYTTNYCCLGHWKENEGNKSTQSRNIKWYHFCETLISWFYWCLTLIRSSAFIASLLFFYFSIQSLPFGNYCWHFASTNRISHHSNACPRSPWKSDSYRCAKICGVFASCSEGINLLLVNIKNKLCSR